jgi:glycosyltransferase involved in cell wall biosynthesis
MGLVHRGERDPVSSASKQELLAISWEMPPQSGPRAVQVTRTLAALAEFGWRSRTVCFGPRSNRYQQDHKVSLAAISGGRATLIPVPSPEEWLAVRALWRLAPPLKQWPDEKRVWMPGALRAARTALAATPANVIVSFAPPWSDHLIGLQLHRETGLPWVAHFADPWIDSPYFPAGALARRRAAQWERAVIGEATRVVFVNSYARDCVMAKYPDEWRARTAVVPQGFEAPLRPRAAGTEPGPLRMVYTGRFYDGVRTPDRFLEALALVNKRVALRGRLEVQFIGSAMAAYAERAVALRLGHSVVFSGRVAPQHALECAAGADVLLVIDAPTDGGPSLFLPSKLVDYLPLRKPILGITPLRGPSADLLNELGYPVVDPRDVHGIAKLIQELIEHTGRRPGPSSRHDSVASRYELRETTRAFAAVLDDAVGAP